jgi:hypothetical protein
MMAIVTRIRHIFSVISYMHVFGPITHAIVNQKYYPTLKFASLNN